MSSELKSYHVSVSPRGDGNVQRRQAAGGDHGSAADVGSCSIKGGDEGLPAEWTSLAAGCLQGMIHLEICWLLSDCCVWDILGYFGHFWMFMCSFLPDPREIPRGVQSHWSEGVFSKVCGTPEATHWRARAFVEAVGHQTIPAGAMGY